MYRLINHNAHAVSEALGALGDLTEYVQLLETVRSRGDVAQNAVFQRKYRRYWRMNVARLSASFYTCYFAVLADCRRSNRTDIAEIARAIAGPSGQNRRLQFSFATKLAHMVDPRIPVYDSFVASFYFYVPPLKPGRFRRAPTPSSCIP